MKHNFRKSERGIFFAKGLDTDSQKSLVGQITLETQAFRDVHPADIGAFICLQCGFAVTSPNQIQLRRIDLDLPECLLGDSLISSSLAFKRFWRPAFPYFASV